MSTKIIDRKIASFTTNLSKIKDQGHEIAMLIFDHAMEHSDCTRAIKLATAMPNSWQPQIEAWFKAFSPIRVIIKNGKCELSAEYKKSLPANKAEFWDRDAALATPFHQIMEEPKVDKEYDFAALVEMVTRLAKQIDKKIEEGKVKDEDKLSAENISQQIKGLKLVKIGQPAEAPAPAEQQDVEAEDELKLKAVG